MLHQIVGFSKLNYKCYMNSSTKLIGLKRNQTPKIIKRGSAGYILSTQYDMPYPIKFRPLHAIRENWELIPLFAMTALALAIMVFHISWAFGNKVDVVYSTHSRDNISRTMDLNHPTVHKLVTINQRYEAYPDMQAVLDKMKAADRKFMRRQACNM